MPSSNKWDLELEKMSELFFTNTPTTQKPPAVSNIPDPDPTAKANYPDVPCPQNLTWEASDTYAKQSEEWTALFRKTAATLQEAAVLCDNFLADTQPSTPSSIQATQNALLQSTHALDDMLLTLLQHYPLPDRNEYSVAQEIPALRDQIPKLLINTNNCILIWLPMMPPKSRTTSHHIYRELVGLLRANTFAPFPHWHCDFIHVFHPDASAGSKDVDNHPYKPFIDALARSLGTGDSAFRFSCGMYNHQSRTLIPGTYIWITKRTEKVQFFTLFENLANSNPDAK